MDEILKYWPILLFVLGSWQTWVIWSMKAQFVSSDDHNSFDKKVTLEQNALDKRLVAVETAMRNMPSHRDLGPIHEKINQTNEKIGHVEATSKANSDLLKAVLDQLKTLNEHHMPAGGDKN